MQVEITQGEQNVVNTKILDFYGPYLRYKIIYQVLKKYIKYWNSNNLLAM